nr:hypothetical protein BCU58_08990 [Vibrio sp. 10N.286.48.B7]
MKIININKVIVMKRVFLGLSLALLSGSIFAASSNPSIPPISEKQWVNKIQIDQLTDEKEVFGGIVQSGQSRIVKMFCSKQKTPVVVLELLGGAYNDKQMRFYSARARVDKNTPFTVSLLPSQHRDTHWLEINEELIESFKGGSGVAIETVGADETKIIRFNLKNFTVAYSNVYENCYL